MARGGINKALVQKARQAILARGENPSIDAIRVELDYIPRIYILICSEVKQDLKDEIR